MGEREQSGRLYSNTDFALLCIADASVSFSFVVSDHMHQ